MALSGSMRKIERVVDHVFLPPKLPQAADEESEVVLIDTTLEALLTLRDLLLPEPPEALDNAVALLRNIKAVNSLDGGKIDEGCLQKTLTSLPVSQTLAVNVSSQNAAVLITRRPEELVIEEFELSPLAADVVQTKGRLTRTFPGLAIAVPAKLLDEPDFPRMIANTLSTMCHQRAPGMQPQSLKAGVQHDESRDTTNPAMVSELFMGVLRGIGSRTLVSSISKNTRDEVLWKQAAAPWRRSPMWLLIRVSIQLVVSRSSDGSHTFYKEIMAFMMSHILKSAKAHQLSHDLIYAMTAKIERRLQKLSIAGSPTLHKSVMTSIEDTIQQSMESLAKTWKVYQQLNSRDLQLPTLSTLNFVRDTLVSLPALDKFIEARQKRRQESVTASFVPSSRLLKHKPACLPGLPGSHYDDSYTAVNLSRVEQWVSQHISSWVDANDQDNVCEELHKLMVQYHGRAKAPYFGNPETTSMMVLTMFELWMACDKAGVRQSPLLGEYDPGIPTSALQNLLLPSLEQMRRLSELEDYIEKRRQKSTRRTDLLFASDNSESFASQYFDKCCAHQALMSKIVSAAETARQAKLEEFKRLKANYLRLDALFQRSEHERITRVIDRWCDPPETEEVCTSDCEKCSYRLQRDKLSIHVHEWPLPRNELQAKAVVFELDVPLWFSHWRDARLVLLQDVLKGKRTKVQHSKTEYLLSANDPHLTKQYYKRRGQQRIDLLSQSKPVSKTHYRSKTDPIPDLKESQICVHNGLYYEYYDSTSDEYPGEFTFNDVVPRACTYTLPCQALQRFILRPASAPDGPEPNSVIASQDACPKNMTLEEFKDFCTLPLGHRIQWTNIMLQLAMPSLDFKKPETTLLLLQCAYQAGPSRDSNGRQPVLRSSHDFFSREENSQSLLKQLNIALQRVKSNWESAQALFVFAAIAARALSLSSFPRVQEDCLAFLSTVRVIAMDWVISLKDKAYAAADHNEKTAFTAKSVEVALICASTFDIDRQHLEKVLAGKGNASMLVQACIVIQEGEHTLGSDRELLVALLEMRHKRLLARAYDLLAQHPTELDDAIKKTWSAYVPGSTWRAASKTTDHWLTTKTIATTQAASLSVQYNLLSGELLANGLPLDQPPQKYRDHPQYKTLFGKAIVEVMPSTTPGFQFSTRREFGGYSVQLGMPDGQLIVRVTKGGVTYETVPSRIFGEAYPMSFVEDHVHWLNVSTNTVQFRPVHEPWNPSSPEIWTLSNGQGQWQLTKSGRSVIGIGSPTSWQLSQVLDPFANTTRIHNIVQPSSDAKTLLVSIPALNLNFTLAQGSSVLESTQFRSMVVDTDQSLGTLVGLRSKIVLKHMSRDERIVLVPESKVVTYQRAGAHVSVAVAKESIHRVHPLRVDPKLGRLLDNGELGCKLFLAYLHALTSFCLVDPLTHKTGTEQALTILRSAAVRSFDQLSQANIDMLAKIAALSPGRCCYPPHLQVMQTVDWDKHLSFLSQHGHFVTAVKALFEQAEKTSIFFPDAQLSFPDLKRSDKHLLQRDNIRSATFRVSGFGAEDHTTHKDEQYAARDRDSASQLATRAATMSRLTIRESRGLSHPAPDMDSFWQAMCACDIIHGAQLSMELSDLKYDTRFLTDGFKYVLTHLPPLHRCLSMFADTQRYKFSFMMWLSTIASDPDADLSILQSLAMFLKFPIAARLLPAYAYAPQTDSFKLKAGNTFSDSEVKLVVEQHLLTFDKCPERNLSRGQNETRYIYDLRQKKAWRNARGAAVTTFVDRLASEWPCQVPDRPNVGSTYINVDEAMRGVGSLFKTWSDNRMLYQYLAIVHRAWAHLPYEPIEIVDLTMSKPQSMTSILGYVSEHSVFLSPAPKLPEYFPPIGVFLECQSKQQRSIEPPPLSPVVESLERMASRSKHEAQYVADLRESLEALESRFEDDLSSVGITADELSSHLTSCIEYVHKVYSILEAAVTTRASSGGTCFTFQGPRLSPLFFLRQLSRSRWHYLGEGWKRCIVQYALALIVMQRAERLTNLTEAQDINSELLNPGHQNWDPEQDPESLLMEAESGFVIRHVQTQVAQQMKDPPDGDNAVMQLNMGEGKSSVIVPIVAAALADGKQLLRVVVAKPQSKQMAQMLISKLGGLLDRRVHYMPISRSLKLDHAAARKVSGILQECMESGGVLLIQPEHILSFQLMAIECFILGRQDVGRQVMSALDFLEHNARDIVDESDENFNVRFELIYTMGMQHPIELSPDRWLVLQEVLELVRQLAPGVAKDLPRSLEHQKGVDGSFPRIRILRPDGGRLLNKRLAHHICENGLGSLQVSRQPEEVRGAVNLYITKADLDVAVVRDVEKSHFWTETTKLPLMLIRGLIACGVLEFTLSQKRWRVNYGLATRTPPTQLAVPYRAKDSPSLRSEFSHPDVVITLTSLSYYYGGLSDEDLFIAMGCLMESDQSDVEYQAWVRDANGLPSAFKQLQGINLKDRLLCTSEVFPALRFAKSVIDFFLAHIVFPKQMKEFPYKLSASGWDIGKRKSRPVTGFSGTNDSRCVLPTDVHHLDHPAQKHTNALVLEYILKPDNGVELMKPVMQNTSDAEHLLATVLRLTPSVQVILDVGAQILELTNIEVAKTWLMKHDTTKEAAVFVTDDDELCVVDRQGRVDLLRASSFSNRLDACLIFLDEAHTRGIDLRLPSNYRAAVTLGASLTKDRLAQACMRMRKLGHGQTVVFCISQEIQAKIMECKKAVEGKETARSSDITVEDVIFWSISETHVDLRRSMPLWAVQGARFYRHDKLWQQARQDEGTLLSKKDAEKFLEKEAQSLDDRFRPRQDQKQHLGLTKSSDPNLQRIIERCQQFDGLQFNSSTLQEEQERELSPEIEQERQIQKVPAAKPSSHELHEHVRRFARDGVFIRDSPAFMPAFESLRDTSAAIDFGVWQLAGFLGQEPRLHVTADFANTVTPSSRFSYRSDAFQRPVQWVLTSSTKGTRRIDRIIIISPYEANLLHKHMEGSTVTALHVFKPRCNSGYATMDGLDFHTVTAQVGPLVVPRGLVMQLALFSGQLYMSSFWDYKTICGLLGLSSQALTQEMSEKGWEVAADGFVLSDDEGRSGGGAMPFVSPVGFLKILMSKIRRNGDGIAKTHMGSLLEGKLFQPSDFKE